jgi:hypothetical protein
VLSQTVSTDSLSTGPSGSTSPLPLHARRHCFDGRDFVMVTGVAHCPLLPDRARARRPPHRWTAAAVTGALTCGNSDPGHVAARRA